MGKRAVEAELNSAQHTMRIGRWRVTKLNNCVRISRGKAELNKPVKQGRQVTKMAS